MNFYTLLGINQDATMDEVEQAYQDRVTDLYTLRSSGGLDDEIFNARFNNLNKAHQALIDEERRNEYDNYLARRNGGRGANENENSSKKEIVKKVATGAICAVLTVSLVAGAVFGGLKLKDYLTERNNKPDTSQSMVDSSVLPNNNGVLPNTGNIGMASNVEERASRVVEQLNNAGFVNEETSQPYTVDEVSGVIEYIDGAYVAENGENPVNQVAVLENKAIQVAQQLKDAGLINAKTGQAYTAEEIKDIIQYINGDYALEGDEAISIVYDFLNLVVTPINNQQVNTNTDQNGNSFVNPDTSNTFTGNYGDIMDDALVTQRATSLVSELNAMNIINPVTCVPYTVDECVGLIKYANGVYVPATIEEIDVMHLNLLNLFISPLNTDPYLFHVVYASGNDDFKDMAVEAATQVKSVDFGEAFCEYGQNGVYPLTRWMQEKREAIYATTDRETINKIYVEVGQVMADIMKGNGCTITIEENGSEKTYKFTSEQILANHASAMLLTIDAQLIFANKYEVRDANDKVVDSSQTVWLVYNKFNGDEPDQVSLDEIEAWINNGCDYEWGIEDVLINGQTFGQRIQGDMEGMAQNNFAMYSGKSLTK